ncbi:DUF3592 domain-containing protein [Niveibacterium sp. COAC-50]|uniref:DUF3592 domain-containing protein n=1 Tax=Niveibacterium sp. COAC-50 TaxID=2729384 RepID=UPI00352FEEF0
MSAPLFFLFALFGVLGVRARRELTADILARGVRTTGRVIGYSSGKGTFSVRFEFITTQNTTIQTFHFLHPPLRGWGKMELPVGQQVQVAYLSAKPDIARIVEYADIS